MLYPRTSHLCFGPGTVSGVLLRVCYQSLAFWRPHAEQQDWGLANEMVPGYCNHENQGLSKQGVWEVVALWCPLKNYAWRKSWELDLFSGNYEDLKHPRWPWESCFPRRLGEKSHYIQVLQQGTSNLNIKRLLLIKENQIPPIKRFSTLLCMERCKDLGLLKSFVSYAPHLSEARSCSLIVPVFNSLFTLRGGKYDDGCLLHFFASPWAPQCLQEKQLMAAG